MFHDEFKEEFMLKCMSHDEKLHRWIDLPAHTNIVTCFDCFTHEDKVFALSEITNPGSIYEMIDTLRLNLAITVPISYIEMIYDCII